MTQSISSHFSNPLDDITSKDHAYRNSLQELAFSFGMPLLGPAIGSAVGKATGIGALKGAGIGTAVTGSIEAIAIAMAILKKRRTLKQQNKFDEKANTLSYLIPGVSTYNKIRRMGATIEDKRNE